MNDDLRKKRIEAYRLLEESMKELYGSVHLSSILGALSKKYALASSAHDTFVDTLGDVILGFYPKSELQALLINKVGLNQANALVTENELRPLLTDIPSTPRVLDVNNKLVGDATALTSPAPQTQQSQPMESEARPLTREELMQKLSPRRTMVEDVASVQHPQPSSVVERVFA